jgi:hypothetical protein
MMTPERLMEKGGPHLGAAREYLLWHYPRGDSLTWGSWEPVTMPVKQLEEMACHIAAKVLNNLDAYKENPMGDLMMRIIQESIKENGTVQYKSGKFIIEDLNLKDTY